MPIRSMSWTITNALSAELGSNYNRIIIRPYREHLEEGALLYLYAKKKGGVIEDEYILTA